jgi:DNA-binding transcriptional ArsR family regulator
MVQSAVADDVFHALSNSTRRKVLEQLSVGPATVSELAAPFDMKLPSFVQHLSVLEQSRLVKSKKRGRVRTYEIVPERFKVAEDWLTERRLVTGLGMGNDEKTSRAGLAEDEKPRLVRGGVVRVDDGEREGVIEDGRRLLEAHAMLSSGRVETRRSDCLLQHESEGRGKSILTDSFWLTRREECLAAAPQPHETLAGRIPHETYRGLIAVGERDPVRRTRLEAAEDRAVLRQESDARRIERLDPHAR